MIAVRLDLCNPGPRGCVAPRRVSLLSRGKALRTHELDEEYEDTYWAEDAMFLERNSRDFESRCERININAEAIGEVLKAHPLVSNVYWPKYNETRNYYEACRTPHGGYGGLISCTFQTKAQAIAFYDALDTAKGPSLGTNFTLASPYVRSSPSLECWM